jgi:hypothetical protein
VISYGGWIACSILAQLADMMERHRSRQFSLSREQLLTVDVLRARGYINVGISAMYIVSMLV